MPILAGYKLKSAVRLNSRAESRRDRINHMRLSVDRSDDRLGSDTIARLVVAG
jgi:hypothetical protein